MDNLVNVLLNKDGSPKKIQKPKTENRSEYQRNYMKEYIKSADDVVCTICGGHYKSYQGYIHNKGKFHSLIKEKDELKKLLII
tara:strand:- start:559 stop:807 length:249 start_codon:yes stop_codon:yes gene_type:complete